MKTCFNCKHLVGETYGDNFHEPMETEYFCGIDNGLLGEGDFVSITENEWETIMTESDEYINQYIAERCSKYESVGDQ